MHAATASNSDRPPPATPNRRARRKRIDLDPERWEYTVGECARAMGVSIPTARRKLEERGALERAKDAAGNPIPGRWGYTTKALIRRAWGRIAGDLIARIEEGREDD